MQDVRAQNTEVKDKISVNDQIKQAELAIEIYRNDINSLIPSATITLYTTGELYTEEARAIVVVTEGDIGSEIQTGEDKINEIEGKAENNDGIKVCLAKQRDELKNLQDIIRNKTINCVTNGQDSVNNIIRYSVNYILNLKARPDILLSELKKCGTAILSIPCITAVGTKTLNESINLKSSVKKITDTATDNIRDIKLDLEQCARDTVKEVTEGVKAIGIEAAECVAARALTL